jgi:antitoxin ParD1/3/4
MATTTMNISLPDSMKAFVDERLDSDGYGTVSEYVRDLIRADQKRKEQERLERMLLERLNAPDSAIDFDQVRKAAARQLKRNK